MDRTQSRRRRTIPFRPQAEPCEGRLLLTLGGYFTGALGPDGFLSNPPGTHVVRPNTPVAPFAATLSTATFIDPSVTVINGDHTVIGSQSYVAPYATLNSQTGYIKIGSKSDILDNATVVSNPNNITNYPTNVVIGDQVSVGYGATVEGPATVGAFGTSAKPAKPTGIGANAVINGATIQAGAVVGALAVVGPGVTIPSGDYVLPGAVVTSQAQVSDTSLVAKTIPANVANNLTIDLARFPALAAGYTNLYQGNSATGANPGTTTSGIFNGNLAAVEGSSAEPGNATSTAATGIAFEPSAAFPSFIGPHKPADMVSIPTFRARVIGGVTFNARADVVAHSLGHRNAIIGDQGQPISFASAPVTGNAVTISSPYGGATTTTTTTTTNGVTSTKTTVVQTGTLKIGTGLNVGSNAVVLGGPAASYTIGNNVSIGQGAVVFDSSIGSGASIGAGAYVASSTVAAGQVIPAGEILIGNKVQTP